MLNFHLAPNMDRDEDIVMIQYPDDSENDSFPVVRWNESGFSIPLLDEAGNAGDQTGNFISSFSNVSILIQLYISFRSSRHPSFVSIEAQRRRR